MLFPWKRNPPAPPASEEKQSSPAAKIAYELYQTRQLLNRSGDHTTDWEIAEKIVRNPVRKALYCCHRPFIRLEKNTWEPLLAWANNQALLSLLGLVGNIGLIIAVTTYVTSEKHRRNAEVLNAWQTITNAHGQAGSGGRIQALEFLNASPGANWRRKFPWICAPSRFCLWDAESLAGIDLTVEDVENSRRRSPENFPAFLRSRGAYLVGIRLPKADLTRAHLEGADLTRAHLEGAALLFANLKNTDLSLANLEGTYLGSADLEGAYLGAANLKDADLGAANLKDADLGSANLEGADLRAADLEGASLLSTNLETVISLTTDQLIKAKLCQTKFPEGISLPTDRDCAELGIRTEF